MKLIKLCLVAFLFLTPVILFAGIKNTKHNLSISGPGTVKAIGETQICVFCHTPHGSDPVDAPLWNRSMPVSAYTMYSSDYLRRTGYPTPPELGSTSGVPGTISRQCLSCHDGTVAIGEITNAPGSGLRDDISMTGVEADGTMLNTSNAFISTNLGKHHPVGIQFGAAMEMPTLSGDHNSSTERGNELESTVNVTSAGLVFRSYPSYPGVYVECTTCHDPHKENGKFLRISVGTHGQNVATTCITCHVKDNFTDSVHDIKTAEYTDVTVNARYSDGNATKVSDIKCVNCHTPHNAGDDQYLTRKVQEQTCFQGASETVNTAPCHGTNGAVSTVPDIETVMNRTYGHGYELLNVNKNNKHTNLDYIYRINIECTFESDNHIP